MNKTNDKTIFLDKWDSQFVWISKGWVKKINAIEACKNLWSHRCGIQIQYVHLIHIVDRCLKILTKTVDNKKLIHELILLLSPQHFYTFELLYTDNKGYLENALKKLLIEISLLKIIGNNEEVIIGLAPLDKDIILLPIK